jgi:membrane protease YdiL (CAAX protease family)
MDLSKTDHQPWQGLALGSGGMSLVRFSTELPSCSSGNPDQSAFGFGAWLDMVVLVGFVEEIPFRGLVFQKLNEFMGFWPASLLGSFLFVCLHLPTSPYTALYIFVFAWMMCVVLKRSGSLWGCIIIHSLNDLLSLVV